MLRLCRCDKVTWIFRMLFQDPKSMTKCHSSVIFYLLFIEYNLQKLSNIVKLFTG